MPYKNSTKQKRYFKEWRKKHPGKLKEYRKRYLAKPEGRAKVYELSKKWSKSPAGIFSHLNRQTRSGDKRAKVKMTRDEFVKWYGKQKRECHYCEIPEKILIQLPEFQRGKSFQRLEIDKMDNSKSYQLNNITLACPMCNVIKNKLLSAKEMEEIGQKYIKPKWIALYEIT